jgi:5-methylcytosine-specific restriction endonuclease McrA
MKQQILKLNANYFPIGIVNWKEAMVDIVSGASYPIDIHYEKDNSGIDKAKISYMNVIKDFKEWSELPIREYDDYVLGAKSVYRLPSVIICSRYDKIIHKKVVFPTKNNIWRRDKFTCFARDTQVITNLGCKNIQDIKEGDMVLNSKGFGRVNKIFTKYIDEEIFEIKSMGNYPIYVTGEHEILIHPEIKEKIKANYFDNFDETKFIYKKSNSLKKGDLVITPNINTLNFSFNSLDKFDLFESLNNRSFYTCNDTQIINYHKKTFDRYVEIEPNILFLLGLYAAEGSDSKNYLVFSLHKKEQYLIDKITEYFMKLGIPTQIFTRKDSDGIQVNVYNSIWRDFFVFHTGKGCQNKFIHKKLFGLNQELMINYMYGVFYGDSHINHKNNKTVLQITSKQLINDIKFLLNKWDIYPSYQEFQVVNKRDIYSLILQGEDNYKFWKLDTLKYKKSNKRYSLIYNDLKCQSTRITSIKKIPYKGFVYDLNIEDLPQYTAGGIFVHNCGYTGKKLTKDQLSIDHIIPSSKGGQNTWENLITCEKSLNTWKGNKSLKECGLKLLFKPEKPKNGLVFLMSREEWEVFL